MRLICRETPILLELSTAPSPFKILKMLRKTSMISRCLRKIELLPELLFFNVGPEHFVEYRILPGKGRLKDEMLVIVMKMVVLVS